MSDEQLKAFLEKVKEDTSLQEKLKAAADVDAVVEIANEVGFAISTDDLKAHHQDLSQRELESVSGAACDILTAEIWESYMGTCFICD